MACNKQVSQGTMAWGCSDQDGHEGPCWAREVARSVRNRKDWEAAQRMKESSTVPSLKDLGMQGEPQTFSIDPDGKGGRTRRLHPEEARRLRAAEDESPDSLENQIVNTAGGVDISGVIQKDPRYEQYEKREKAAPGNDWKDWEDERVDRSPDEDTGPSGFEAVVAAALNKDHEALHEPTKQRPGDQKLPIHTDGVAIQDLVIQDIEDRKRVGLERYGTLLQANNGRSAIQDLYEELLDACCYLKQILVENE